MPSRTGQGEADDPRQEPQLRWLRGRRGEGLVFIFLAVLIWPILAIGLVGGYGFIIWMYQLIAGPPGPPGG